MVPADPQPDQFYIEDIAHALSLICRGNGQVKTFFSVGQHCIWAAREAAARGYSRRVQLACLLHDACESYLSDVPSPFKKTLPGYNRAEDRMLAMVYRRFLGRDLTEEEAELVKRVDKDLLYYDLRELLGEFSRPEAPELKVPFCYEVRPFAEVEREYLELFRELNRGNSGSGA